MKKIKVTFPLSDFPKETIKQIMIIKSAFDKMDRQGRELYHRIYNQRFGDKVKEAFCELVQDLSARFDKKITKEIKDGNNNNSGN